MVHCYGCSKYKEKGEKYHKLKVKTGISSSGNSYYNYKWFCSSCYNKIKSDRAYEFGCLSIIVLIFLLWVTSFF